MNLHLFFVVNFVNPLVNSLLGLASLVPVDLGSEGQLLCVSLEIILLRSLVLLHVHL